MAKITWSNQPPKQKELRQPQTLDELFALHATPGSVLEPDLDLPPILFSKDNQQSVKKLNVSVISGLSSSEQYQHQMITKTRKI